MASPAVTNGSIMEDLLSKMTPESAARFSKQTNNVQT
jgi:hypothetical protein